MLTGYGLAVVGTFILTWNPKEWPPGYDWLKKNSGKASAQKPVQGRWSTGNTTKRIQPGDMALLLRQQSERGILASGTFVTNVYQDVSWKDPDKLANYADVAFDHIVETDDRLDLDLLKSAVPLVPWDNLVASGMQVRIDSEQALLDIWAQHIQPAVLPIFPDEVPPTYTEGSVETRTVNRYERDPAARAACLKHFGSACAICGFDFEKVYGIADGRGVHVHHLRELSTIGRRYRVDPTRDLIPVCPNCHTAIHSKKPALTPKQVKTLMKRTLQGRQITSGGG